MAELSRPYSGVSNWMKSNVFEGKKKNQKRFQGYQKK
jgi:hypothetical protein